MSTQVYRVGLCYASVCTDDTDEAATRHLNLTNPTGLDRGWSITDENFAGGEPNPCPCNDNPATHRHLLFAC